MGDPYGIGAVEAGEALAGNPSGPLKRKRLPTLDIGLAARDLVDPSTPDEDVQRADQQLRAQGLDDQQIGETYLDKAKRHAVQDFAGRRAAALKQYGDERSAAATITDHETGTQFIFRALGDIAGAIAGGDPNAVSDKVRQVRAQRRQAAEQSADRGLNTQLAGIQGEQQDERYAQGQQQFAEAEEDRARRQHGAMSSARALQGQLPKYGIQSAIDPSADPEAFLGTYGPQYQQADTRAYAKQQLGEQRRYSEGQAQIARTQHQDDLQAAENRAIALQDRRDAGALERVQARPAQGAGAKATQSNERIEARKMIKSLGDDIYRAQTRINQLEEAKKLHGSVWTGPFQSKIAAGPYEAIKSDDAYDLDSLVTGLRVTVQPRGQGAVSNWERQMFNVALPGIESDAAPRAYDRMIAELKAAIEKDKATMDDRQRVLVEPNAAENGQPPGVLGTQTGMQPLYGDPRKQAAAESIRARQDLSDDEKLDYLERLDALEVNNGAQ